MFSFLKTRTKPNTVAPSERETLLNQIMNLVSNQTDVIQNNFSTMLKTNMLDAFKEFTSITDDISKLSSQVKSLKKQKEELQDEVRSAKKEKEMEELELKHLIAMKEERMQLDIEKKTVELEKTYQTKEMELIKSNFKEVLNTIDKSTKDTKDLFTAIMKVLPNVNLDITKDITNVKS